VPERQTNAFGGDICLLARRQTYDIFQQPLGLSRGQWSCSPTFVRSTRPPTLTSSPGPGFDRTKEYAARQPIEVPGLTMLDRSGYTSSMKTAISIPDDVFEEAERLAAELQTSRSQLYSRALKEFVARHAPDRLTEAMNRVVDAAGAEVDEFSQRAAYRVLERIEW
jgi:predicted transcriptional regulator